jgi:hypothetical protein
LLLLLLALWILVQIPFVQTWLVHNAAGRLSKSLKTKVTVSSVSIGFFNSLNINGVFVADRKNDTLVTAGEVQVNITDWFFARDSADLKYVRLRDVNARLYRNDSVWNYQFLVDYFSSPPGKKDSGGIALQLKVVDIENLHLEQFDRWRGKYMIAGVGSLHMEAKRISLKHNVFDIEKLVIDRPEYREFKKKSLWSQADSIAYWHPRDSASRADAYRKSSGGVVVRVKSIELKNGQLEFFNRQEVASEKGVFDSRDIVINSLGGTFQNLYFRNDSLTVFADIHAKEKSGLDIKRLHTRLLIDPHQMEFAQLDLQLNESRLQNYYAMHYTRLDDMDEFIDSVHLVANLENSTLSIRDIGFFAPELKGMKQVVQLAGLASGTVSRFAVSGLDLRTGQSHLTGSYSMAGLVDINKTIINFQTAGSQIALNDVAVWAPEVLSLKNTPVGNLGVVTYAGSFAGTVNDFAAKGKLSSALGTLGADFKLKMAGPGKGYTGIITNASFDGGKLLAVDKLGHLQFNGTVSSKGFASKDSIIIKGDIASGEYNGYSYQNINAEAVFQQNRLKANLTVNDENLAGNFETVLDFNEGSRRYNGSGVLLTADLRALGFLKDSLRFSGEFDVDFKGKTIDDFQGYARFYNTEILLSGQRLSVDSLLLQSELDSAGTKKLSLHTNEADASIEGKFNISDLGNSFTYFLNRYYPAIVSAPKTLVAKQEMVFYVRTRQAEPFLALIDKRLHGLNYSKITGSINTTEKQLFLNADISSFGYDKLSVTDASIKGSGNAESLNVLGSIAKLSVNDSISFPNAVLRVNTNRDTTHVKINTSTTGPLGDAEIDGLVFAHENGFEVLFNESSFIINNKKWTINSGGNISLSNGLIKSTGLELQQNEQLITLFTKPGEGGKWNDVNIDIRNLNTGDLMPYLVKEPRIEGIASGNVLITDPLGNLHINSTLQVGQFRFNNDSVGTVNLLADYTKSTKKLNASIESDNKEYDFSGKLMLDFNDSAAEQINTVIPLRNMRINVLAKYVATVFDQLDGFATGEVRVVGKLKSPSLIGRVRLHNGVIKVGYTKVVYNIDSADIELGDNYIDFGKMTIKDSKSRTGTMEGRFYHRFFDSLSFDLHMRSSSMEVLNTGGKDNDLFFGKAIANASFDLTGPLNDLNIRISATPTDSSHIYITNKTTRETGTADFVVFKTYGTEMHTVINPDETNFHMDIDLNATPLAKVDLILDQVSGDIIKANGAGNLKIHTGTVDETTMRGRYAIQSGSYNYSFQTLIRKPFELNAEDDNFIEWTGDATNPSLNINARYVAKKVSMSTLVSSSGSNTVLDNSARDATGDVYVIARIKGLLSRPDIDFQVELAPGSTLSNNLSARDLINRINADASERLRQVTYLIVFKSFAPYKEGSSIRNPGTDLAVNTISELVSREMGKILTNVIQQITGDQSLNVDVSTNWYNSASTLNGTTTSSGQYDRVNVNFSLNRTYFNNRVVVNLGSDFDLSVRNTTSTGFQFLPDISVEFILTSNRRLRAILFKRDNLDIGGRRNRAGASLSYRRDFDKFTGPRGDDVLIVIGRKEAESAKQAPKK